jgi:hypothetical protein
MMEDKQSWLLEMWKIKVRSWREAARLYFKSGVAMLAALVFPAAEMRRLDKRLAGRRHAGEDAVLRRAGRWFAMLERLGLRPSCLARSLTLARVLREEGHDACIVFGVRSDNGEMEGHCWVAMDGTPVTEAPTSFKELRYG